MRSFVIPSIFTAVDKMSGPLGIINRNTQKLNQNLKNADKSLGRIAPGFQNAANAIVNFATASGGIMLGGLAAKSIMDYDTALKSLQAVTGVNNAQMDVFKSQIKNTAQISKASAIDVAKSYEIVGSAMSQYLSNPVALGQITEAGITLARASRQELAPTLENLTNVMNQFGFAASEANNVINRLTAGEIVGSVRTADVATQLQAFGAGAKSANVNLGESIALIQALGKQMPVADIGVKARNILLTLSAAKGLDKKALNSLRLAGVNTDILMNKTLSLGDRLKELSKIQNDATGMVNVFGKENATAAGIIFNQLPTYMQYESAIQKTNEAQKQASINSTSLASKLEMLKNTFLNTIITSDNATSGLGGFSSAVDWATRNMDTIITVIGDAGGAFLAWKAILIGVEFWTKAVTVAQWLYFAALTATNIPLGIMVTILGTAGGAAILIISLFRSFYMNWERIKKSFTDGGFLSGLLAIGTTLIDVILWPLQKIFELVSKIPGLGFLSGAASGIESLRNYMGVTTETPVNTKASQTWGMTNMMQTNNATVDINVNDKNNATTQSVSGGNFINLNTGKTMFGM